MPGHRYSNVSSDARPLGLALLELTRGYESLEVSVRLEPPALVAVALVARSRHLLQGAYARADRGDAVSAVILMRSITESIFTLAWLNQDPELAYLVWMLDEIRTRLGQHREVMRLARNQRLRDRRHGRPAAPLPPGATYGTLTRANVRSLGRTREHVRARAQGLPRYQARLRRLKVTQLDRMPSYAKRAEAGDAEMIYSLTYRFDSDSAAHPSPLALEQFLDLRDGRIIIRPAPEGPRPDPYVVGAVLLGALVELAGRRVDQSELTSELERIQSALLALPRQETPGEPVL